MLHVVEMSMAISLNGASGSDAQLSYEHTLTMQSPAMSFHNDSCLVLLYTAMCPFSVKLVCVAFNGTYNERTLYNSRLPLGLTTHKIKLPIPATAAHYRHCALAFQVKTMTTGVAAVFSDITVLPSHCPSAS